MVGSVVLALSSFVYVVGFAPMDETANPRAAAINREPTRGGMISNIRRMMAQGQITDADRTADLLLKNYPEDPSALFWRATVDQRLGDADSSHGHWAYLDREFVNLVSWSERYRDSELDYFRAWSKQGIGEVEESKALFTKIADDLEERSDLGADPASRNRGAHYNLACYRAMSGDLESAIYHWQMAVENGYGGDGGWWLVDPDLESLHEDDRFWEAGGKIVGTRLEMVP